MALSGQIRDTTLRIFGDTRNLRTALGWVREQSDEIDHLDPTLDVSADTSKADRSILGMRAKLDSIRETTMAFRPDDAAGKLALANLQRQADKLQHTLDDERISITGMDKAELGLLRLEASADRLKAKLGDVGGSGTSFVTRHFGTGKDSNRLSAGRLFKSTYSGSAFRSLFTGGAADGSGLADIAGSPVGIGAIGTLLASLPALLGGATGLGIGAAGAYGSYKFDPKAFAGPLAGISGTLQSIFKPIAPAMATILQPIAQMLKQIAPTLRVLFPEAVPGIKQFISALMPAVKQILPQLGQILLQLNKSGAMRDLAQGFGSLLTGSVKMISGMSSAFESSAALIRGVFRVIGDVLKGFGEIIGKYVNYTADILHGRWGKAWDDTKAIVVDAVKTIQNILGSWSHDISHIFDDVRHYIANDWDNTWQATIGKADDGISNLKRMLNDLLHDISSIFDNVRHTISSAWDTIWSDTTSTVNRGVSAVEGAFSRLAHGVFTVMDHLPGQLWNLAKDALENIVKGAESVVPHITSFFSGFAHGVVGTFKKIWGWFSPSAVMYEGGKSLMEGLEGGIKDHAHKAIAAAATAARGVHGMLHPTGSGATVERLMESMARSVGWTGGMWNALFNVEEREAGFDLTARNQSSGAYGLAQFIEGPGEYYRYGGNPNSAQGQITAMFNYIRQRYGNPERAWAHELAAGWYGKGLAPTVFSRPTTIGVGEAGPEIVSVTPFANAMNGSAGVASRYTSGMGDSGNTYITIEVAGDSDPDGAAKRIHEKLRRLRQHQGNQPLGLG